MSNDLNQCSFIGRLGSDPETRYSAGGDAVTNFRIAVGWKSKDKEGVEWVGISTFGKLAEICGQYLKKGSQVYVSGRFKTEEWTDKEGAKRQTTKIVADTMQMLGSKPESAPDAPSTPSKNNQRTRPAGNEYMDDDIPF